MKIIGYLTIKFLKVNIHGTLKQAEHFNKLKKAMSN